MRFVAEINVNPNKPDFLNEKQLSVADINKSRKIASVGIHVEHTIGRIKTSNFKRSDSNLYVSLN